MEVLKEELLEIFKTKEFEVACIDILETDKQNSIIIDACHFYNPHALMKYATTIKKNYPKLSKTIREIAQKLISASEAKEKFEAAVYLIKKSAQGGYKHAVEVDALINSINSSNSKHENSDNPKVVDDSKDTIRFIRSYEYCD